MCHGHEDTTCLLLPGASCLANCFCSFVLFGWDLEPVMEIPPFVLLFSCCAFCACMSPIAGWRVGRSIGATAVRRSPGRIELCDESDRIDLSEQTYCLYLEMSEMYVPVLVIQSSRIMPS